jgi:hypothetical protein
VAKALQGNPTDDGNTTHQNSQIVLLDRIRLKKRADEAFREVAFVLA